MIHSHRQVGQPAQKMPVQDDNRFAEFLQDSIWGWAGLLFAFVLLAWVVVRLRDWFREDSGPADDRRRMLSEIRELYHEGDLSEQEYRSIKGRLMEGMDRASADISE